MEYHSVASIDRARCRRQPGGRSKSHGVAPELRYVVMADRERRIQGRNCHEGSALRESATVTGLKRPGCEWQFVYSAPNLRAQHLCSICAFGRSMMDPRHTRGLRRLPSQSVLRTGSSSPPRYRPLDRSSGRESPDSDRLLFESVERPRQALRRFGFPARWSSRSAMVANGVDSS